MQLDVREAQSRLTYGDELRRQLAVRQRKVSPSSARIHDPRCTS